jgi:hypothetical protein
MSEENTEQQNLAPVAPVAPPVTINEAPSWFIDDGIPGAGQRPSWMPEKFKTVADLAKSNLELEKRLGTAPDEYDFSKSRYLDPDYVPFDELKQLAKEKRVPQEVMDKMLESVDKYMDEFKIDDNEEINKLGANAHERLETLNNWAKANLSNESYEALTSNLRTAESVRAIEEIRNKMMSASPQIPSGNTGAITNNVSLDDLKLELTNNLDKYKTDPHYRRDLQARLEVASKNAGNFVDKTGP